MKRPIEPQKPNKPSENLTKKIYVHGSDFDLKYIIEELNKQSRSYGCTDIDINKIRVEIYNDYYDYMTPEFSYILNIKKDASLLKKESEQYKTKMKKYEQSQKEYEKEIKDYKIIKNDRAKERKKKLYDKLKKEFADEV